MSLAELFSERNVLNSVAAYLASRVMDEGYLVYWHKVDAVQTPDAMYSAYSVNQATYLADATFNSRVVAAKGLVTITEGESVFPRFAAEPTTTGTVSTAERVQVPCFGIDIGPEVPLDPYEHGSYMRWRVRSLLIQGRVRDRSELAWFSDRLGRWFDEDYPVHIEDHDNTSGEAPTIARVTRRLVTRDVVEDLGEQDRFQVELNARLEFVA